ncbi:MAG: hypothetical protein J0L51_14970 [Rhizobiales bacterium]|nr:hypothetical protein [Hyphomicrobiales bacterium]
MKYLSIFSFVIAVVLQIFISSDSAHAQTYHPRYAPGTIIYAPQYNINIYARSSRTGREQVTRRVYRGDSGVYRPVVYRRPVNNARRPVYSNRIPALVRAPRPSRRAAPVYYSGQPPRVVQAGGACGRVANPVSRQACYCSVANGGFAQMLPSGQVGWTRITSGAAYHRFQQCIGTP